MAYIENNEGKILCVWNRRGNGFSLPGGKCEEGETLEAACARELKEETGMIATKITPMYNGPTGAIVDEGRGNWVYLFRVEATGEPKMTEENCPVKWMTKSELIACSPFAAYYRGAFRPVPKISVLHKLSHWLGLNSEFRDTYAKEDEIWTCERCNRCGRARNERQVIHFLSEGGWGTLNKQDIKDILNDPDTK